MRLTLSDMEHNYIIVVEAQKVIEIIEFLTGSDDIAPNGSSFAVSPVLSHPQCPPASKQIFLSSTSVKRLRTSPSFSYLMDNLNSLHEHE